MVAIDVMTAYVICGAGSLVGAAMLRLADLPQSSTAVASRFFTASLVLLALSLGLLVAAGGVQGSATQLFSTAGVAAAVTLWVWGLGHLSGDKVPTALMLALLVLMPCLPTLCAPLGPNGVAMGISWAFMGVSATAVYVARRFIVAPHEAAGKVLGGIVLGLAVSSLLRLFWTLNYEGEPQPHLLHVPAAVSPFFAVFYGVLPFFISATLLIVVNGRLRSELSARASTDELTGVNTRRALRELAPAHIAMSRRGRHETALLMLDLDHFKAVNDRHGHAIGDLVLRHAAALWRDNLRPDSLLARYGGEEFVALVPVEDMRAARLVAERLRAIIATAAWDTVTQARITITTSIGVTLVAGSDTLDEAMKRADEALYRAKGEGRNQVQVALHAA